MQQIKKDLKKLIKKLDSKITERHDHFLSKAEEWQYGPIGDKYLNNTDILEEIRDLLDEALSNY